jgi:hypothetical protein
MTSRRFPSARTNRRQGRPSTLDRTDRRDEIDPRLDPSEIKDLVIVSGGPRVEGQCVVMRKGWEPYEAELREVFGFVPERDPEPPEWLSPDEFQRVKPYFDAMRRGNRASLRAEEALGRRRLMARNIIGRNRATKELEKASAELTAAKAQQGRLDDAGVRELRLRAEDRLRIRRQGLELPPDLSFH